MTDVTLDVTHRLIPVPGGRIHMAEGTGPGLVSSHILDGCGHWVQQERPGEVNGLLAGWLHALG